MLSAAAAGARQSAHTSAAVAPNLLTQGTVLLRLTAMEQSKALELQRGSLDDYVREVATASPESRLIELDGVVGAATPARSRSIANSVAYRGPAELAAAYPDLAAAYDEAGIEAWTVWVPEFEAETIALLEGAGHNLDGKPTAMTADLRGYEPPDLGDLDWDADCRPEELAAVNDAAYGFEPHEGLRGVFRGAASGGRLRLCRARVDGQVACALGAVDRDGDCGIYFVATDPAYRGRGLATRLMAAALAQAAERGCESSTLQSSPSGRPIYEALGYEPQFALHLYERRS
jgi:ribosomal protein S18 acetylase RimI-like enzyme